VVLEAICRYVPPQQIAQVLARTGRESRRLRKLPATAVVWLVIAMGLWAEADLRSLWRQVAGTLRSLLAVLEDLRPPTKSALSQARSRLGARPLRQLLVDLSAPIATAVTRGAFYKGMRLMIIDGQKMMIPDTPANRGAFGASIARHVTPEAEQKTESAYPLVQTVRLMEAGTHLTVDLLVKPARSREFACAAALLQKLQRGDLLLWDKGFYSFHLLHQAIAQGTALLARLPKHILAERVRNLSDGSYLAWIHPTRAACDRLPAQQRVPLLVRVLEYSIDDPTRPGHGERHRLVTTLTDEQLYPALELIVLYHQRWEIEIANDEMVTHQLARGAAAGPVALRSRTPAGVVQEVYGIHLAHNAVRALMHESALSVDLDPRQLSFMHAVRVIRETATLMRAARTEQLPRLYAALIRCIACGRLPPREDRLNPRVVKVKMSHYLRKRPEHYRWPQPQRSFAASLRMLN
jgi:hypothetical protein